MDKTKILTKSYGKKVLKLLLKLDDFTTNDYILLVKNNKIKDPEYLIPLIKYKFNFNPPIILLNECTDFWFGFLKEYIILELESIHEYINIVSDDILSRYFEDNNTTIDINILKEILNANYNKTFNSLIRKCSLNVDNEMLFLLKQHANVNVFSYWNFTFDSKETFLDFIKHYKVFNTNLYNNNLYFLDTKENFDELYNIFIENSFNNIDFPFNIIKGKHEYMLLKLYLLNPKNKDTYLHDKINKYPDIWNIVLNRYYNNSNYNYININNTPEKNIIKILDNFLQHSNHTHGYISSDTCIFLINIFISNIENDENIITSLLNLIDDLIKCSNSNHRTSNNKFSSLYNKVKNMLKKKLDEILAIKNNTNSKLPILNE